MIDNSLAGQDIYLLGSGHSLKGFDFDKLNGKNVIAINHSIEYFPQASMMLFGDKVFLEKTTFDIKKYKGKIFTSFKNQTHKTVQELKETSDIHIFDDVRKAPSDSFEYGLYHPTSSGMLALNLALIMGAGRIYLLGFDYNYQGGIIHFYDYDEKQYKHHYTYPESKVQNKVCKFKPFEKWAGKIINLSMDSFINVFPKQHWQGVFE